MPFGLNTVIRNRVGIGSGHGSNTVLDRLLLDTAKAVIQSANFVPGMIANVDLLPGIDIVFCGVSMSMLPRLDCLTELNNPLV